MPWASLSDKQLPPSLRDRQKAVPKMVLGNSPWQGRPTWTCPEHQPEQQLASPWDLVLTKENISGLQGRWRQWLSRLLSLTSGSEASLGGSGVLGLLRAHPYNPFEHPTVPHPLLLVSSQRLLFASKQKPKSSPRPLRPCMVWPSTVSPATTPLFTLFRPPRPF